MARRTTTIARLAEDLGLDEDEALIRVWDAGLEGYGEATDRIRRRDLDQVRRALDFPTRKDLIQPDYWCSQFGITRTELSQLLLDLGVPMSRNARTLPKGAIRKLKSRLARETLAPTPQEVPQEAVVDEAFEWRIVGHKRDLRLLTQEEVEAIHWELAGDFVDDADPIDPPGVRSDNLLGSAVFRQHTAVGKSAKYPTVEMAAAALLHAIVHDHPFHNGNKRTALVSMLVLLDENGVMLTCDEDELFRMVVRLAQHRVVDRGRDLADREMNYAASWICDRSRLVDKTTRPVQWRKLRKILSEFECELIAAGKNRINIERAVEERVRFGKKKKRVLRSQVKYTDEGREVQVPTLSKIRKELELDDDHGVDSEYFYHRAGVVASEFIAKYRKTLKRLARL